MSKRTWSTENEVYKKFKWIPFKIDSPPWNGLLKRQLWRRMIDMYVLPLVLSQHFAFSFLSLIEIFVKIDQ